MLLDYLRALYARDFERAYPLISPQDRELKPRAVYLQENPPLQGAALEFSRLLASLVVLGQIRTNLAGDRATISFRARLPDGNAARVRNLAEGFDASALDKLPDAERARRKREIVRLAKAGRLPTLDSPNEEWHLVRADGRWWLDLDWTDAVRVRFRGVTMAGLAWTFAPSQDEVRARPGETLQLAYRAKNTSDRAITAKARHVVGPDGTARHLEIVSCFCFLEQTLQPGQEVELPVVFRVSYDAPDGIGPIDVRYEFYPAPAFPKDAAQ